MKIILDILKFIYESIEKQKQRKLRPDLKLLT